MAKSKKSKMNKSPYLSGRVIDPKPMEKGLSVTELVDNYFLAYNAGRLREACNLYVHKMLADDTVVGMTLTGALTPAGLGKSTIIPLIKAGFVDFIISTGANLYHDAHFGLGLNLHQGSPFVDDTKLRNDEVVRIYDIVFDYHVLLDTDSFFRQVISEDEFQKEMTTSEFHYRIGKYLAMREKILKRPDSSILSVAHKCGVPIYTSSPGDSSIGMNFAALALEGNKMKFDIAGDINETAALVLHAKRAVGKSGIFILGGGSPKNFALQTEPQIQEVLGINEKGHDYFLQVTDARPDTGGLSGATPSEAVSWGKVDPNQLPNAVVCYLDSTVALPMIASYALTNRKPRKLKKLYDRLGELLGKLKNEYYKVKKAGRR